MVKELADNALDAAGGAAVVELDDGSYVVQDVGPGIPGTDEEIAALFSIRRPLTSSKLVRLPTRGAMGNGLRVVAGAVMASGGRLVVTTGGRTLTLCPQDDGGTAIVNCSPSPNRSPGTRIEVSLGDTVPADPDPLIWAEVAIAFADGGTRYKGKTSGWWYDADTFFELCSAAGERTVREVVEGMDGCTGAKAGEVAAGFAGRRAADISRDEASRLLGEIRARSREVKPSRLGYIGDIDGYVRGKVEGVRGRDGGRGGPAARVPFVVEAFAKVQDADSVMVLVNRSPITGEVSVWRGDGDTAKIILAGCGLNHNIKVGRRKLGLVVNVTTPYMPVVSGGKAPDLSEFVEAIASAVITAARRAKALAGKGAGKLTTKDIIVRNLPLAVAKASGDGQYRYSIRQLFYARQPAGAGGGSDDQLPVVL
ncbi:MAG TPA: hypothetical protein VH253_10895 [Phycisphaerae bacterium]|nr:hypothetical protein [Phycisphaerae bacterium]